MRILARSTLRIADPAKATHETQNWITDLYHAAQLSTRAVVNSIAVEALLGQKVEIGAQLLARVQPEAAKIGIDVLAIEVKDVMLPADLKRAFADVLKAKQEGQAALERARGESAPFIECDRSGRHGLSNCFGHIRGFSK